MKKMKVYCDAMIACMKPRMGVCSHRGRLYYGDDNDFDLKELDDDADRCRFLQDVISYGCRSRGRRQGAVRRQFRRR